ncbi:hypothetical protein BS17DRAFT_383186 [Gyrodon lividus]|nr:hypothetical protein BS17DRAFT_383186 [Gyrodon lividus]
MSAWPPFFIRLPDPDFIEGQSRLYRARGNSGIATPAQPWSPPHNPPTRHPNYMERFIFTHGSGTSITGAPPSSHPRSPCVVHGFVQQEDGRPSPDTVAILPILQPPQRTNTQSGNAEFNPAPMGALSRSTRHAWHVASPGTEVPPNNNTPHGLGPPRTRVPPDMRGDHMGPRPPGLGYPRSDTATSPVCSFPSAHQSWDQVMETGFVHQPAPSGPLQMVTLPSPRPPGAKLNCTEDDEEETSIFLCEWMDAQGPCNMQVLGDRISMSQHLSRFHDVVGDEKVQRPCLWRGCTETMNKGSLARHVVSRHLRAGASCGFCSKVYSRLDVVRRHIAKCKAANASPTRQDDEW